MSEKAKVTFQLPQAELDDLRRMAEAQGVTMTTVIRRSFKTEKFFRDTISQGNRLAVINARGEIAYEVTLI